MTATGATPRTKLRARWAFLVLAVIFFGPMAAAWVMYSLGVWRPGGTAHHGELIDPPRPLPRMAMEGVGDGATDPTLLEGKWTVIVLSEDGCDDACRKRLYLTRQMRLALGRDTKRTQRLLLVVGQAPDRDFLEREHPLLTVARRDTARGKEFMRAFAPDTDTALRTDRVYLVDPLANLMSSYPGDEVRGLLEDLKRLLRLSQIG